MGFRINRRQKVKVSGRGTDRDYEGEQNPMQLWKGLLKKFVADESGQSSTEYILILFLAFMVFSKIKGKLQPIIDGLTQGVDDKSKKVLDDNW